MYMGIWSHERYISVESEVGSLQSTDALSGHADVTFQANVTSACPLKASVDCRLPTSDSTEIYLS